MQRRRTRRARALPVYLGVTALAETLRLLWSEAALRWDYWALKELLLRLLTAAVVVEITARVFARLPCARRRVGTARAPPAARCRAPP